ncbi:MAG: hypothetical protein ACQEXJ_01725 [Myxococcota bacterium]
MRDPWHDETLEALVVYLRAALAGGEAAWAVVETSGPRVEAEVSEDLRARLSDVHLRTLRVDGHEPPGRLEDLLELRRVKGPVVTIVRGLSELLEGEQAERAATWLNLRREELERPGEAYLFVLSMEAMDAWLRLLPDLHRYAQHFRFVDWEDVLESARAAADVQVEASGSHEQRLRRARARVETLRTLGDLAKLPGALASVAGMAWRCGHLDEARAAIDEVVDRASYDDVYWVTWQGASLELLRGCPQEAWEFLAAGPSAPWSGLYATSWAVYAFHSGEPRLALTAFRQAIECLPAGEVTVAWGNRSEVERWLGEVRKAGRSARRAVQSPSAEFAGVFVQHASARREAGRAGDASRAFAHVLEAFAHALEVGLRTGAYQQPLEEALRGLAGLALDQGRPGVARALLRSELLPRSVMADGYQIEHAWLRARLARVLGGSEAVREVVADEEERQAGWDAPIPAAELAFARGLAAATDEEARRHLQDASDRYRAMEGWLYLSEVERWLARLDRLEGDLDHAEARVEEGLAWHEPEGARPAEARDRIELSLIALGRGDARTAREEAGRALELIRECETRLDEPAALVALAAAERALGRSEAADAHDARWRRLVRGMEADGLMADLERDADWAAEQAKRKG